jgi:hypothetical protein
MTYSLIKNFDGTYTLTNLSQEELIVNVFSKGCCNCEENLYVYKDYTIAINGFITITPKVIGNYSVEILTKTTQVLSKETIFYMAELQKNFIDNVIEFLCGDPCQDCKKCLDTSSPESKTKECGDYVKSLCDKSQTVLSQLFFMQHIIIKDDTGYVPNTCKCTFETYIQEATKKYFCDLTKDFCKQVFNVKYAGKNTADLEILKKFVAIYYVGFYLRDYNRHNDTEKPLIKDLYKMCYIESCIKALGLSYEDLVKIYEENDECSPNPVVKEKLAKFYFRGAMANTAVGSSNHPITIQMDLSVQTATPPAINFPIPLLASPINLYTLYEKTINKDIKALVEALPSSHYLKSVKYIAPEDFFPLPNGVTNPFALPYYWIEIIVDLEKLPVFRRCVYQDNYTKTSGNNLNFDVEMWLLKVASSGMIRLDFISNGEQGTALENSLPFPQGSQYFLFADKDRKPIYGRETVDVDPTRLILS